MTAGPYFTLGRSQTGEPTGMIYTGTGAYIPPDLANEDYRVYLAWLAEGNAAAMLIPPSPQAAASTPIVLSPNGTQFAITVDDEGTVTATPVG